MAELILALDLPSRSEALRLLDQLSGLQWVKVGSILMTAEGPGLVRELLGRGLQVFLDLKWHDIPHTVAGSVEVAGRLGVRMATVHASGGSQMLRAAADAAPASLSLVGVTVLTSHRELPSPDFTDSSDDSSSALRLASEHSVKSGDAVGGAAERLARAAIEAGLSGVVCSPHEVPRLRGVLGPKALIVVPGIRRPGDDPGDQQRTAGPAEAVRRGATHLVVGRPILTARNPAAALDQFLTALSEVSGS
jgi:orotidine-5'-phosphate decarboxylase